jgi:DNA (cytosine-5)-methyltransferase 1
MENISMFEMMYPTFKIDKPIRLIELFAGVGSQAMALRNIGADFEHYKISEWDVSATASYKAIHVENDNTDYSLEIEIAKLPKILFDYGISTDGKKPMTLKQIERKGEKWQRITYNNLRATNNLGSICNFKGEDLEIVDTDSFTYLLTYSFPCQDLSVAGKRKGMSKGDNTRSGLLWEVERLLNEVENLPQVLLMENVPQVISDANIKDFQLWQKFLEEKGYSNYTEILNAKDYGVAQNRERCFMVSILGEWNYKFPKPIPLTKTMKDYLEDEVDEKYYINNEKAQKLIDELISSGKIDRQTDNVLTEQSTIQTQEKSQTVLRQDTTQESATYVQTETWLLKNMGSVDREPIAEKRIDIACTLCARDYKGFNNYGNNGVIEIERKNNM